ncbi:MAG: hypothetical protein ACOCUV_00595 [bacterium]
MPQVDRTTPDKEHVQSVIFDKKKFTINKAKSWLKDNDMYIDGLHETEDSYRFRQYNPSDNFKYRSKKIEDGVTFIIATKKRKEKEMAKSKVKLENLFFKLDDESKENIKHELDAHNIDIKNAEILRKTNEANEELEEIKGSTILEDDERTAIKYVSTRAVDSVGDVIIPKGVMTKEFETRGRPVYWNHNYSIPQIGADEWVKRDDYGVKVKMKYGNTGEGTLSEILWRLTKDGMNKQSSVGILILEALTVGDEEFKSTLSALKKEWPELKKTYKSVNRIITKSMLMEHSDVGMACNMDASRVEAISKSLKEYGADNIILKQLGIDIVEDEEEEVNNKNNKNKDELEEKSNENNESKVYLVKRPPVKEEYRVRVISRPVNIEKEVQEKVTENIKKIFGRIV